MKNTHLVISLLLTVFIVSCCKSLSRELMEFKAMTIRLPEDMLCFDEGLVVRSFPAGDSAVFVVYYGRDDCSSCRVAHMYDNLSSLEEISAHGVCAVRVIFAPPEDDVLEIIDGIRELKFPFPIYVDSYGDFARLNPGMPEDLTFHTFLMDDAGHPVFVGNPAAGERLHRLFFRILDSLEAVSQKE